MRARKLTKNQFCAVKGEKVRSAIIPFKDVDGFSLNGGNAIDVTYAFSIQDIIRAVVYRGNFMSFSICDDQNSFIITCCRMRILQMVVLDLHVWRDNLFDLIKSEFIVI